MESLLQIVPGLSLDIVHSIVNEIHPHCVFGAFLQSISCDHLVLLDFLMSDDDAKFLSYLMHYLHFATDQFDNKENCLQQVPLDLLEQIVPTLIHLRLTITRLQEKKLFVYPAKPLVKRLKQLEDLWESE